MNEYVRLFVLLAVLIFVACTSEKAQETVQQTSEPQSVDAAADNAAVLGNLQAGLVITLEIDGETPSVADARVSMVPAKSERRQEGELISVTGRLGNEQVSSVRVPDQRINSEEEGGLVRKEQRTIIATVPLPKRIDTIVVQLPGADQQHSFEVKEQIESFCREYPQSPLCR